MTDHTAGAPARIVLIVEDASTCAETLEAAFSRIPRIALVFTNSAEDALELLDHSSFAALITDINLPGMDGLELVSRLRSSNHSHSMPILVISGDPNPDTPQRALHAGANAFFAKPFSPAAVRRMLEELLDEN
jgi:two-component system chemotaxis response regulator CheY